MKTGLQTVSMPQAGLGTWAAGQATDSAEVEATIEAALEAGVRLIDTATVYFNEATIGKILKKWMDAGIFFVASNIMQIIMIVTSITNYREGETRGPIYSHKAPKSHRSKCCPPYCRAESEEPMHRLP